MDRSNDIVARDCLLADNSAGENGGTIASLSGHGIILRRTPLRNSVSGRHGGGIFASSLEIMDASNTAITSNDAGERGGIFSGTDVGSFRWRSVRAEGNKAPMTGAVHVQGGGSFELEDVQFVRNRATEEDAGAIQLISVENVTINSTTFLRNVGSRSCGALSVDRSTRFEIFSSEVQLNRAESGGGICVEDSQAINLTTVQILANHAQTGDGGALRVSGGDSLSISNSTLIHNNASNSGGALFLTDVILAAISDTTITNSTAEDFGGCLYARSVEQLELEASLFAHCEARDGGAALFTGTTAVNGQDTRFEVNIAGRGGGAFLCNRKLMYLALDDAECAFV